MNEVSNILVNQPPGHFENRLTDIVILTVDPRVRFALYQLLISQNISFKLYKNPCVNIFHLIYNINDIPQHTTAITINAVNYFN